MGTIRNRPPFTPHRNAGSPRPVISDRGDASEDVLEKHYDEAGSRLERPDRELAFRGHRYSHDASLVSLR